MADRPDLIARVTSAATAASGSTAAVVGSIAVIVVWAATGPLFGFSDTWQLVINTGTTILTFVMVFFIQNAANREGRATQVKLDEILRALAPADSTLMGLEEQAEHAIKDRQQQVRDAAT